MQNADWLFNLKEKVPQFLERLKGKKIPGFFHYSLSGDLYDENINWGLGNTVFAAKLIDLCLSEANLDQACNSLDSIYVIHYANKNTEKSYRYEDIQDFCQKWLQVCKEHYFPDIGSFSFYKHRANQYYYGAKITKGLNEPDIHGTVLLFWGIAIISDILGIEKELGFKEFVS